MIPESGVFFYKFSIMLSLTKHEKVVLLALAAILFFGGCLDYILKRKPQLIKSLESVQHKRPAFSVDLNSATLQELISIPGIGPVTAQKILDYRWENGFFKDVSQLKDIYGIGDVRYQKLAPYFRISLSL